MYCNIPSDLLINAHSMLKLVVYNLNISYILMFIHEL